MVGPRVVHSVSVQEYEYNGKKYAHVKAKFGTNESNLRFSDGKEIISEKEYWLHVEPLVKMFESNQVTMSETIKQQEESETRNEEIQINLQIKAKNGCLQLNIEKVKDLTQY